MVATTFRVEQSGNDEAEDDVQFSEAVLAALFDTKDGPLTVQDLIRTVDQIKVAVTGADQNVAIEDAASRWEHSLYFSVGSEEVAGFGVFFGDWKNRGLPLWVGVPESNVKKLTGPAQNGLILAKGYREPENGGENPWEYRAVNLTSTIERDNPQNLVQFLLVLLGMLGLNANVQV